MLKQQKLMNANMLEKIQDFDEMTELVKMPVT
jgi:hypothetical protein